MLITYLSASVSVYLLVPKVQESFPYLIVQMILICMIKRLDKNTLVGKCVPIKQAWLLLGTPTRLCPTHREAASHLAMVWM